MPPLLPTASALECSRATVNPVYVDPPACSDRRSGETDLEQVELVTIFHVFRTSWVKGIDTKLTSILFFQVTLAQQYQTDLEGQHANLTGSLTGKIGNVSTIY